MSSVGKIYIFGEMQKIKGYMDPNDALAFQAILSHQNVTGLGGSAAEIGVYYGRSYYLIRKLMKDGEKVFAADLFNIGESPESDSQQLKEFEANGSRLNLPVDRSFVFAGASQKLTGEIIREKVGPVRFFSVDGGHLLEHVESDAAVARDALAQHGVLAFDDVYNHLWPEVALGVFSFLERNPDLAPIAITSKKMYISRRSHHAEYLEVFRKTPLLNGFPRSEGQFCGDDVILIEHPIRKRILFELLSKISLARLAAGIYKIS